MKHLEQMLDIKYSLLLHATLKNNLDRHMDRRKVYPFDGYFSSERPGIDEFNGAIAEWLIGDLDEPL